MAFISPRIMAAPAAVAVAGLVCARWPLLGVALLLFLSGTRESIHAFTGWPVASATDLLMAGLGTGALIGVLVHRFNGPRGLWPGATMLLAVVAVSVSWILLAENYAIAETSYRTTWVYVAMALAVAYAPWPERLETRFVQMALGVALLVAGYAIYRWIVGPAPEEESAALAAAGRYQFVDQEVRLVGSAGDGHALSSWMTAMVPFGLAIVLMVPGRIKLLAALVVGACFAVLIGAEVRSALAASLLGCVAVVAVMVIARNQGSRRLAIVGLTLLLAGSAAMATSVVADPESRPSSASPPFWTRPTTKRSRSGGSSGTVRCATSTTSRRGMAWVARRWWR